MLGHQGEDDRNVYNINLISCRAAASAGDAIPKISSKIGRMALTQRIARSFIRFMQSVRPRVAAPELAAGRQRRLHVLRRRSRHVLRGRRRHILRGRSRHILSRRSECRLRGESSEAEAAARREHPAQANAEILRGHVVQREEGARTRRRVLTMHDGGLGRAEIQEAPAQVDLEALGANLFVRRRCGFKNVKLYR